MGNRIRAFALGLAVLLVSFRPLAGADPGHEGTAGCAWENKSLIVAKVLHTERDRTATQFEGLQDFMIVEPKMTLAGRFDCSGSKELKVPVVLGPFGGPLLRLPLEGSLVTMLLELCNDGYFVPGLSATYMPESKPVWEIWGFHDEALLKIVSIVGERRRDGAKKDQVRRADCAEWLTSTYPKHARHITPLVDKSFETQSIVFARVKSVTPPTKEKDGLVSLRLIGTVAGRLDSALVGEVEVAMPAALLEGRKGPWRDAEMFVALDHRDGKFFLPKEPLDYMPSGWTFSHLETSPDAMCDKILANLRKQFVGVDKKGETDDRQVVPQQR